MQKNRLQQGFTLIELLVVIAIIGILSAVVLASLNTARLRGNDASIQSNLATIRTQAEIFYGDTNNTYGIAAASCTAPGSMFVLDTTIARSIAALEVANGASSASCHSSPTAYAISSPLSTNTASHWCVDNRGTTGVRNGPATGTTCPAS